MGEFDLSSVECGICGERVTNCSCHTAGGLWKKMGDLEKRIENLEGGNVENEITYPCIMRSEDLGMVVQFSSKSIGTVIIKDNAGVYKNGESNGDWNMEIFKPCKIKVDDDA